jgi:hypothetical protein
MVPPSELNTDEVLGNPWFPFWAQAEVVNGLVLS